MATITVERRFRGPIGSANGGYFAGLVAAAAGCVVRVRLLRPPPLEVAMTLRSDPDGQLTVLHQDVEIARAQPARIALIPALAPNYIEALDLACRHPAFEAHPHPECFVCGTRRARGDGLRIHPGLRADGSVAAPWIPDASLIGPGGRVRPEFTFAALDCCGYFAASRDARNMLLGEFTAHADRLLHLDEPCVIVGWHISSSAR